MALDPEKLADTIAGAIGVAHDALLKRITAVEARVAELDARPSTTYKGVWQDGEEYFVGDLVTRSGSMWACRANHVKSIPGVDSVAWTLAVKRGAAGKDLR